MKLFCFDCDIEICVGCLEYHKNHNVSLFEKAIKELKEKLSINLNFNDLRDNIKSKLQVNQEKTDNLKRELSLLGIEKGKLNSELEDLLKLENSIHKATEFQEIYQISKKYLKTFIWSINSSTQLKVKSNNWRLIKGTELKEKNKYEWKIKIHSFLGTGNTWGIIIGVANKSHENQVEDWLGKSNLGWGYVSNGLKIHNSGIGAIYGESFGVGDVITCNLDLTRGELSFKKNEKDQKVAFNNVNMDVCIACSISADIHLELIN